RGLPRGAGGGTGSDGARRRTGAGALIERVGDSVGDAILSAESAGAGTDGIGAGVGGGTAVNDGRPAIVHTSTAVDDGRAAVGRGASVPIRCSIAPSSV